MFAFRYLAAIGAALGFSFAAAQEQGERDILPQSQVQAASSAGQAHCPL